MAPARLPSRVLLSLAALLAGGAVGLSCAEHEDPNFCGDGRVGDEEQCDDGNPDDNAWNAG